MTLVGVRSTSQRAPVRRARARGHQVGNDRSAERAERAERAGMRWSSSARHKVGAAAIVGAAELARHARGQARHPARLATSSAALAAIATVVELDGGLLVELVLGGGSPSRRLAIA